MYILAVHFAQSGQTLINCSYNVVCRKIQKPVLLRLRLAASEKPVLNAPAFACIAKPRGGREHGADGTAPRAAAGRI